MVAILDFLSPLLDLLWIDCLDLYWNRDEKNSLGEVEAKVEILLLQLFLFL